MGSRARGHFGQKIAIPGVRNITAGELPAVMIKSGMLTDQIITENPILADEGSLTFDGYLARRQAGSGPGFIIITEMWGNRRTRGLRHSDSRPRPV
jgi:hypothetical protein